MNRKEVIELFKHELTQAQKIDIFNWYIKEEAEDMIVEFEQFPDKEFRLSEQKITHVKTPKGQLMLNYSMLKIKEHLGIINRTNIGLIDYLIRFKR